MIRIKVVAEVIKNQFMLSKTFSHLNQFTRIEPLYAKLTFYMHLSASVNTNMQAGTLFTP